MFFLGILPKPADGSVRAEGLFSFSERDKYPLIFLTGVISVRLFSKKRCAVGSTRDAAGIH